MANGESSTRGSTPVERWIQHVLQGLTVLVIGAAAAMMFNLAVTNEGVQARMDDLIRRLDRVELVIGEVYSDDDASRDLGMIRSQIADHEARLRALEGRPGRPP